jgi:hypothetical protein
MLLQRLGCDSFYGRGSGTTAALAPAPASNDPPPRRPPDGDDPDPLASGKAGKVGGKHDGEGRNGQTDRDTGEDKSSPGNSRSNSGEGGDKAACAEPEGHQDEEPQEGEGEEMGLETSSHTPIVAQWGRRMTARVVPASYEMDDTAPVGDEGTRGPMLVRVRFLIVTPSSRVWS